MSYSVTRLAHSIIQPSESTPSVTLDLSAIDSLPALRCKIRTLHVFKHGQDAATVIKVALSKALVPYYPLAGRFVESRPGLLQVDCTGEGIWFVEASANCSLDAVNYLDNDLTDSRFNLLPDPPSDKVGFDPLVLIQVTQFTGDGFIVGLEFSHGICDGLGSSQFLNAVGELARGFQNPSIAPVWCREALTAPPRFTLAALEQKPPPPPNYKLQQSNMDISLDYVGPLKRAFFEQTGRTCSAFEAITASIWRYRTRAIALETDTDVKLVFFANVRKLTDPPLPEGYYGNCFFPVIVTASSWWLAGATNIDIVRLIQEGKEKLRAEFGKWMAGDYVGHEMDPFAPPLTYSTLFVSEWARLGFRSVDYGWGPPINFIPIQYSNIVPVCVFGAPTLPMTGIRLMTWCMDEAHLDAFRDQLLSQAV
ncbi:acyl transferase 4 [Magnolia sinica]|uniref:acyl transferase 4 n=1 Tax=Magnolia sinica TaxID=86752 RepID=UPI0026588469|nr:acyl transferase 4 [Magnolia sinica]